MDVLSVLGAVVVVGVIVAWHVLRTYNEHTKGERLRNAVKASDRSIDSQFKRPPNESDWL